MKKLIYIPDLKKMAEHLRISIILATKNNNKTTKILFIIIIIFFLFQYCSHNPKKKKGKNGMILKTYAGINLEMVNTVCLPLYRTALYSTLQFNVQQCTALSQTLHNLIQVSQPCTSLCCPSLHCTAQVVEALGGCPYLIPI